MTNSFADFKKAKMILMVGTNMSEAHPVASTFVKDAMLGGAQLIVVDPRRTDMVDFAQLHVQIKVGSDVAFINGLMNVLINENLYDKKYVDSCTVGFEDLKKKVMEYPPERAAEISGVTADMIRDVARRLASVKPAMLMYTLGITEHICGVNNVMSCANLQMLLGNVGFECGGVNPLRGQNNVQGACDMGGLPNVYPAYQPVNNPDIQKKFEAAWNAKLSDKVGLTIPGVLEGLSAGTVKAVYIVGENPMVSDPDVHHVEKALRQAELLVVQDIFLTPTAELAHVVLPGASFAEKDGTFSNTERRVQRVRKAIEPIGESRADWEILQDLSTRFGYPMKYESPAEIMAEVATVAPSYGGISYDRLEGEGLFWPCVNKDHPGTRVLHQGKFSRGLGLFHAIDFKPPAEEIDTEYPFWLTTGRVHVHYHTGTMTRNSPSLHAEMPEGFLEINPQDAKVLGVRAGDRVKVSSRRGEMVTRVDCTKRVTPGMVFMPFHFVETCANILTNPANDPIAKIPEYKVCAVKLEKAA